MLRIGKFLKILDDGVVSRFYVDLLVETARKLGYRVEIEEDPRGFLVIGPFGETSDPNKAYVLLRRYEYWLRSRGSS